MMPRSSLLLIHGEPCSGKTTVATRLAQDLGWTLLSKDTFKEPLFEEFGTGDRAWSRRLSDVAWDRLFAAAERSLLAGRAVIIEGNLRVPGHEPNVAGLCARSGAACAQVLCHADAGVLRERRLARAAGGLRHPGHLDEELATELTAGGDTAALLAGTPAFAWDTSSPRGADHEALLRWLAAALPQHSR
jgi:predicted kinase